MPGTSSTRLTRQRQVQYTLTNRVPLRTYIEGLCLHVRVERSQMRHILEGVGVGKTTAINLTTKTHLCVTTQYRRHKG